MVDNKLDAVRSEVDLFASDILTFVRGILIEGFTIIGRDWPMTSDFKLFNAPLIRTLYNTTY